MGIANFDPPSRPQSADREIGDMASLPGCRPGTSLVARNGDDGLSPNSFINWMGWGWRQRRD